MEEFEAPVAEASGPPVFSLVPYNDAARRATAHPSNSELRYPIDNGRAALYISFANEDKQVFTLGRVNCDIFLPDAKGADISKHHCSFFNTEQGAVLLEDKSAKKNTEPYSSNNGGQRIGFGHTRRVLVARGINNMIGIGNHKYYQFEIHWHSYGLYQFTHLYHDQNYRTGPQRSPRKRYIEGDVIGGGGFGQVCWAMDVHSGSLMAVKKFHNMDGKNSEFAKREIKNMFHINKTSSIHHDHILEILDYAGGGEGDTWGEIFMPLKQGNLKKLACDPERTIDIGDLADLVLYQMLLALACLAEHKIVHRDIKPENILWEDNNGAYHFRLGDFGLSNTLKKAVTPAGTEPFMAPEIFYGGKQTTKVDIWSLFATVVWVKNVNDFQQEASNRRPEVMQKILMQIAETVPEFYRIRRMASWKPKDRPSAKQVLKILEKSNEVDDMADLMANGLLLDPMGEDEEDDGGVGPSLQPGLPYYEPYQPYLPEQYNWEGEEEEEGGSNTYVPPPVGASPRTRGAAYMGEAFVKPYGQVYSDPDSGTVVPDVRTATQLPTEEMDNFFAAQAGAMQPARSRKGKEKAV